MCFNVQTPGFSGLAVIYRHSSPRINNWMDGTESTRVAGEPQHTHCCVSAIVESTFACFIHSNSEAHGNVLRILNTASSCLKKLFLCRDLENKDSIYSPLIIKSCNSAARHPLHAQNSPKCVITTRQTWPTLALVSESPLGSSRQLDGTKAA